MPDLAYDPPVPPRPMDQPFIQRIDLRENGKVVATLHWHAPTSDEGVIQLLDIWVIPEQRRRGDGSTLLAAAVTQIKAHCKSRRIPVRRLWLSVEQKAHVNARAFLTRHGFHHIATVKDLLRDQDALIYNRSFD